MKKALTVRDIMSSPPVMLTVDMDIYHAVSLFLEWNISGAPVVEGGAKLAGVLSEKDCMEVLTRSTYEDMPANVTVGELMTEDPETIAADASVMAAAETLMNRPYRRLAVVDDDGDLIGQVTCRDILAAIQDLAEHRFNNGREDRTQQGSLITSVAIADMVGPETNKRFG